MESIANRLIDKLSVRAFSMIAALILILGGISMCFKGLQAEGNIDLKTAVVEGQIETGSLGIMAMFLGVIIVISLNLGPQRFKGQEVHITKNGDTFIGKGLSYRKMKEVIDSTDNDSNQNA